MAGTAPSPTSVVAPTETDPSLVVNVIGAVSLLARSKPGVQCLLLHPTTTKVLCDSAHTLLAQPWASDVQEHGAVALSLLALFSTLITTQPSAVAVLQPLLAPGLFQRWTPVMRAVCAVQAPERLADVNAINRAFPPPTTSANASVLQNGVNSEGKAAGLCAVCMAVAVNMCGRCKQVFYCTPDHQKLDWKSGHKVTCKPPVAAAATPTPPAAS
jgi:hypothetical protein